MCHSQASCIRKSASHLAWQARQIVRLQHSNEFRESNVIYPKLEGTEPHLTLRQENRRRTNVQQLTCKIDSSNSFYYLFLLFYYPWAKTLCFEGESPGGKILKKCQKVLKSAKNYETVLPFSCCPLVFLWEKQYLYFGHLSPVRQGPFPCSTALFLKNSHRAGPVLQEFGLVLRAGVWHSTSVVQAPPWG